MTTRSLTRTSGLPSLAASAALALTLAGCGSSDNGIADKTPNEILAASKAAAQNATSVHVTSNSSQRRLLLSSDLRLTSDGGSGRVSLVGIDFQLVRIGDDVYVKGSPTFTKRLVAAAGHDVPDVPNGTWLKGSTSGGALYQLAALADLRGELARILSTSGTVTKGATTTIDGHKAVALNETTKLYKGTLYVATTGKPYPLAFVKGSGRERGHTSFSEWDQPVSLSAPSPVVDLGETKG